MAYRKIIIAVDCASDAEAVNVQAAAKRMSEMFRLRGSDVLAMYPLVEKNGDIISNVIRSVAQDGLRGLASAIPYLIKNIRK
jgi:hypothetical protein